ncbi:hypothetical protein MRX96_056780 [Rhipicephalus microplus]
MQDPPGNAREDSCAGTRYHAGSHWVPLRGELCPVQTKTRRVLIEVHAPARKDTGGVRHGELSALSRDRFEEIPSGDIPPLTGGGGSALEPRQRMRALSLW